MNYRIRRSEISDIEILGQVHARAWQESYVGVMPAEMLTRDGSIERRTAARHKMFERMTTECGYFLAENHQGEIVGFGDCGPAHEVKDFVAAEIYTLYVLRVAQGFGVGKKLINKMLGHLAQHGFDKAALSVLANNEKALRFYSHMGGKEVTRGDVEFGGIKIPHAIYLWTDLKKST